MALSGLPAAEYLPRVVDGQLTRLLRTAPAVVVEGARASGKTWTGRRFAASEVRFDELEATRLHLELEPGSFLEGPTPRLLDEWHLAGGLWNAMRHACDDRALNGQFILAGSVKPTYALTDHSGAGRVARLRMRPMSLFESGDSTGAISLEGLLNGELCAADAAALSKEGAVQEAGAARAAELVCRGGLPRMIRLDPLDARGRMLDYLRDVAQIDLATNQPATHDPAKMLALITSLARNETTSTSAKTLIADTANAGGPADRDTVSRYVNRLVEAFVLEPLPAWSTHLRSKATLRTRSKRYFVDPSMAAAALRATPPGLLADTKTFGLLFESLAMRDLRVYAQSFGAEVRYYQDSANHEVDAIITRGHRDWAAAEIKLGGPVLIEKGIKALRWLRANVDTDLAGEPRRLMVITASGRAFETKDGIAIVPINHLAP
ncbi:MAG: DUF4143 domain-containing protein [bacterium]|nr:DUF4143 domain-containing protein [bacterium]